MKAYEDWDEDDIDGFMRQHKWWFRWYFFKRWVKGLFKKV